MEIVDFDKVERPFPCLLGNEEEKGLLITENGVRDEPYRLATEIYMHLPLEVRGNHDEHLANGFRFYAGGSGEVQFPTNLEVAIPEVKRPKEAARYIRGGDLMFRQTVTNYVTAVSTEKPGELITARMQRRNVDSQGSRKACHDNFCLEEDSVMISGDGIHPAMRTHLSTRSLATGSLFVRDMGGLFYAQKIGGLDQVEGYDWGGTMGRYARAEYGQARFEARCGDINISDWATTVRIGTTAIMIALIETGLADSLDKYTDKSPDDRFLNNAKALNQMHIDDNGNLTIHAEQRQAIAYQRHIAELTLTNLGIHADIPNEYYQIATELYEFCDDFEQVVDGRADVSTLADRADWAAKLVAIRASVDRDRSFGIERFFDDYGSAAVDLGYDHYSVKAQDGQIIGVKQGYGHRKRDRGDFRWTVTRDEEAEASVKAPDSTRAGIRSEIIRTCEVTASSWGIVVVVDPIDARIRHKFILPPRLDRLSVEDQEMLRFAMLPGYSSRLLNSN